MKCTGSALFKDFRVFRPISPKAEMAGHQDVMLNQASHMWLSFTVWMFSSGCVREIIS